jgi:putative membrane protein
LHGGGHGQLDPLEDQHLGGAIMLAIGGVSYLAGGLWLTAGLVRQGIARREARA